MKPEEEQIGPEDEPEVDPDPGVTHSYSIRVELETKKLSAPNPTTDAE